MFRPFGNFGWAFCVLRDLVFLGLGGKYERIMGLS